MNGSSYYGYQSVARGLLSEADVEAVVRQQQPVYDRLLRRWLPARREAALYEVACGPGIMLRYLRGCGYTHLAGSDSSACQIELAQAARLPVKLADSIAELKAHPAESWDGILAIDFIEHLPKDVLIEFYAQAHRTLKPGGVLILRGPNGDSPFVGRNLYNDITHFWAYTAPASRALLGMAGFPRTEFADEAVASVARQRWLKVPLMKIARWTLRGLIRTATREQIEFLDPSLFIAAWKPG